MRDLDALATLIIGVSPDTVESHKKFIKNHRLEHSLLSDERKEMCHRFGVLEGDKVIRSTFLIDSEGMICSIEKPANVEGHVDRIIAAVKEHCPASVIKFDDFNADYAEFLQGGFNLQESEKEIKQKIKTKFHLQDGDTGGKKKKEVNTLISVTILTKNSRKYLTEVLSALKCFDEVILYDTGSTDDTLDIGKKFPNVTIYREQFIGFGPTHNKASGVAKHDWILSIDSDEIVTAEMAAEIQKTHLNPQCVYSFPRNNYFNGKFIKWCGWYPDRQIRLYNRKSTTFSDLQVHEGIRTENLEHIPLQCPMRHYSYSSISHFLEKMQLYSDLYAKQNQGKISSSLF